MFVRDCSRLRRFYLAAFVSVSVATIGFLLRPFGALAADEAASPRTVSMVIDYDDGIEKHFTKLSWKPEMTVMDALKQASQSKHGITFKSTGSGLTAFVTQIDDVKNEGGGANARNWVFRINGKLSPRGTGTAELRPQDRVNWKFAVYEP